MTTPAHDAPFVFPSVAFRPLLLLAICVGLAALATLFAGLLGHAMFGVFFAGGLGLGLVNAILVQRSVAAITAQDHPLKKKMVLNSATRLAVITVFALTGAFIFRPTGTGVMFGLALFQLLLVLSTVQGLRRTNRAAGPGTFTTGAAEPVSSSSASNPDAPAVEE